MRSTALAWVFAIAAVIISIGATVQHFHGRTLVPLAVLPFPLLMSLHQLLLVRFTRERMRNGTDIGEFVWYASAFVDISLLTCAIFAMMFGFAQPVYALFTPAVLVYFVFIIFSTLRLDPGISLFTGATAAVEYFGIAMFVLWRYDSAGRVAPLFLTPVPHLMKSVLLLAGGVGAAFVAREMHARIRSSIEAVSARERSESADRAKSVFLAHMSHEIRAPLNAILGYAHLLEADRTLSDDQRHAVTTIGSSGDHLLGVINQVLDLSRIEAGREELNVRAFDLPAMLRDVSAMFEYRCRQKRLQFRIADESGLVWVQGDVDRLRQVLINLLENAVRATRNGSVSLSVSRNADNVRFDVVDTGPGIPASMASSIFEPFRQLPATHASGTGLGLAIARAQTTLMGGVLRFDSAYRGGARFSIDLSLPAALPQGAQTDRASAGSLRLAAGSQLRALVVDDSAADRALLAAFLERIGASVRTAADGAAALSQVRNFPFDVVFLDRSMPGMTGVEVLSFIRAERLAADSRMVAVSASALDHERREMLTAGFDAFLAKPVRPQALQSCLADICRARFTHANAPDAPAPTSISAIAVPDVIWLSLRRAAENCSITDLKKSLEELSGVGPGMAPLVERLRGLSRQYDMEAVVSLLDEVSHV